MISVKGDVKELTRYLTRLEKKQVPYATALALKNTVWFVARTVLPASMPRVFDRPTRWTKNAFYATPKRPNKRDLSAAVHIKEGGAKTSVPQFSYLQHQISGGPRRAKRHEISFEKDECTWMEMSLQFQVRT